MAWSARLETLETRPGILVVDEVDHEAMLQAVGGVAERAAADAAAGEARQRAADGQARVVPQQDDDENEGDQQEEVGCDGQDAEGRRRDSGCR